MGFYFTPTPISNGKKRSGSNTGWFFRGEADNMVFEEIGVSSRSERGFIRINKIFGFLSGLLLALFLFQPFLALAIVYQPGETLNPACAPTDAGCGVAPPITASSTSALSLGGAVSEGSLLYVAGTSTLQNIIPAGNLQYSIGSPDRRLQNVYTNNLILGSASFVMENVGGVLRFRDVNSAIPGLVIDPASGATINGNVLINGGATFANATTTGSHSIGSLVLGGTSFQNLVGAGLKAISNALALDNSGDWAGTLDGQEASYFLANSFSTSSANLWLGSKATGNLIEGSNLYWTPARGDENFASNLFATTTDALAEGAANKYYTDARFDNRLTLKTTNDLTEGLNVYYTDTRARNALSAFAPLSYSTSTGIFSLVTGNITAPSNPEFTITGGTGAVVGSGVTFSIPEAGATMRGLVTTGAQTFSGDKTFSGTIALSGALNVAGVSTFATSGVNSLTVSGTSTLTGITGTNLNIAGTASLATATISSLTLSQVTQGSLLFAGAGGLVSQNNSNLFWDNANNRLGVGTASPSARLYVKTSDLTSTPFYIEGQDNAFTGLSGWFYRKPVVIDNTINSAGYSNQQTFVSFDTAGLISAGKLQSNCADLRFTNTDGASILPHWIEYGCNSAATGIWVKIPTLPAGITKTIYAYYGNPTAASTSNGAGVFTFFDDFPTNQARFYNTEYPSWTVQSGSWIIPSGNYLANYYGGDMITVNSPSAGIGTAVRAKMTETGAWKYARLIIGWQDVNNYYVATLNSGGGQLNIYKVVGGVQTTLANINASVTAGTWYEVELRWASSTTIEAQIWDANGNSLGAAQGAISEGWTGGKFGAHGINGTSTARFENYMTLQYAPNISSSIGAEESSGAPQQLPFFVVKNQTGKIGIGEANPGAKLSVSGGLAIGSDFDTTSVSDGNAIFSGKLGIGVVSPTNALTFAASSVIDSQGALSITTASGGSLSLTSNGSGNVVIDSGSNGALNIGAGANGKTITLGNTTGTTGLVFNSGSGNINFDGGTLYVDTVNNRIGIGTNTPAGAMHIPSASNANAFIVTDDGSVGIGTIPDATKQFQVKFDADKGALFDGRTNPRVVTVGVVRFEHTAGAEGTKPVFYDIDAAGYANTHATEVTYKTGAMTGISNVHDIEIDGTNANGAIVHGLKIDAINADGIGKIIGLGVDTHTDPIEQHTGAYINDTQSWYYNLSAYTDITAGTPTIFNVDESYVYVGADTAFSSIQVGLAVVANQNINPVFTYWNGSAWVTISPSDGTNGLTNSGVISVDGLTSGWSATSVNGVSKYYIQIRRTRNSLNTSPQLSSFLTNNAIDFYWDKTGKLKINTIETTGNVGIGTSTPGYLLTMGTGGGYYNQSTGAWINGSDRAYKDNILDLTKYGLETIKGLRPVSYIVKESGVPQIGFIAQEVNEIVPEIVSGEDGAMGVNYGGFTPVLVKAVQEIASLADSFKHSLVMWFADTANGIADFFAKKIHTEQICLKKSDGNEFCINGDDAEAIMGSSSEAEAHNYGSSTSIIERQESESTDSIAPISNISTFDVDNSPDQEQILDSRQQQEAALTESAPMEITQADLDSVDFAPSETVSTEIAIEPTIELAPEPAPIESTSAIGSITEIAPVEIEASH